MSGLGTYDQKSVSSQERRHPPGPWAFLLPASVMDSGKEFGKKTIHAECFKSTFKGTELYT